MDFGGTDLLFSPALPHGYNDELGYVVMTQIARGNEVFVHAADVLGPPLKEHLSFLIDAQPTVLYVDGPMTHMPDHYPAEHTKRSLSHLLRILRTTNVRTLILDHHILRDRAWRTRMDPIFRAGKEHDVGVLTAAEFAGKPVEQLEEAGLGTTLAEVRREIACRVCQGDIKRCRLAICPYLDRVRAWFTERRDLQTKNLFGASPPSAFVGSWGYPKVLVGPLVPPVRDEDTSILDASESWLSYDLPEILRFRLSLVRGKAPRRVAESCMPDRILDHGGRRHPRERPRGRGPRPPVDLRVGGRECERPSEQRPDLAIPAGLHVRRPRSVEPAVESDAGPRPRVRGRPDDLPGPDRGRVPCDPPPRPRTPRGPSTAGRCHRVHGSLRRLGAARGLAVPGTGAGGPGQEDRK